MCTPIKMKGRRGDIYEKKEAQCEGNMRDLPHFVKRKFILFLS